MGSRWLRIPWVGTLAIGAGACVALAYSTLLLGDSTVHRLAHVPDGVIQNAGAVALLGASIGFGVAYARTRRRAYLVLTVAFFIGAGEEASWGQFIVGFTPPEAVREVNAQDELTVHNLDFLQNARRAVGFDLTLALFIALALAFLVAMPWLAARSDAAHERLTRWIPIPPAVFGALLLASLVLFALAGILSGGDRAHAVAEIAEAGISVIFLAVALDAARAPRPERPRDRTSEQPGGPPTAALERELSAASRD